MSTAVTQTKEAGRTPAPNLLSLLKPYRGLIAVLIVLTISGNALNLALPKIVSDALDSFQKNTFQITRTIWIFASVILGVFIFSYVQSLAQTYVAEKVARDLRKRLIVKISLQDYGYIQKITAAKLLTHLTSDVDGIKNFVSQAVASIVSSLFLIIGASVLLLNINVRLGLAVLTVVPIIGVTFFMVLSRVRALFKKSQEALDWLNKVINESILGAALIRLTNSQTQQYQVFLAANTEARGVGLRILSLFALLIPVISLVTNLAMLTIVVLGGHFVMNGVLTLGELTAFASYLAILIFPILIIGFMSNVIAQASASFQRISGILDAPEKPPAGTRTAQLTGDIEVRDVSMVYGERSVLKHISFRIKPGTKTAIIGPTAAGKSQLLCVLTGLLAPSAGAVLYDGQPLPDYEPKNFHEQVGFVFQDSLMFNTSVRENIAFTSGVAERDLERAVTTAELTEFIESLPNKLETIVSERGTSLSGGQKQRIMLARALAGNPRIIYLDDFTARVDAQTEERILKNIEQNYPNTTLISVTQKIAPIAHYDHIILLMEGELLAEGTHEELLSTSPEYVQIFNSQQSTSSYEVHA